MRVLTWNLFHGRSRPGAGRGLLPEFAELLAGWDWDVALLQEVPPWWPPELAFACAADQRSAPTSRNCCLPVRRALSARNPDLLRANGGGANTILSRTPIREHHARVLTRRPERRVAHGVHLAGGPWVVNLHATTDPKTRTRADLAAARRCALDWASGAPLVMGGDLNSHRPRADGFAHLAAHHLDHVFARGWEAVAPARALDAGALSDHAPVVVRLRAAE